MFRYLIWIGLRVTSHIEAAATELSGTWKHAGVSLRYKPVCGMYGDARGAWKLSPSLTPHPPPVTCSYGRGITASPFTSSCSCGSMGQWGKYPVSSLNRVLSVQWAKFYDDNLLSIDEYGGAASRLVFYRTQISMVLIGEINGNAVLQRRKNITISFLFTILKQKA